jgi:hypothetical protein
MNQFVLLKCMLLQLKNEYIFKNWNTFCRHRSNEAISRTILTVRKECRRAEQGTYSVTTNRKIRAMDIWQADLRNRLNS